MNFFWFQWAVFALIYLVASNAQDIVPIDIEDFPTTTSTIAPSTEAPVEVIQTTSTNLPSIVPIPTKGPLLETQPTIPTTTSTIAPSTEAPVEVIQTTSTDLPSTDPIPTKNPLLETQPTIPATTSTLAPSTEASVEMIQTTSTNLPSTCSKTFWWGQQFKLTKPLCRNCYYTTSRRSCQQLQWTSIGWKYVQTIDCYHCCRVPESEIADCTPVEYYMCDNFLASIWWRIKY